MLAQAVDIQEHVTRFLDNIPDEQWRSFDCVLSHARRKNLHFAMGGALAFAGYSGRVRNTKDLDIYVVPDERPHAIQCLANCGFKDYFDELPYDRKWIYRGKAEEGIIDIIWAMANQRTDVDRDWLTRGPLVGARGHSFRLIPPEELIWSKMYVLQRERSDWPDILNVIEVSGAEVDWDRLLRRLGDDMPLLRAVLSVYQWLSPKGAKNLPVSLWSKVQLPAPVSGPAHVSLLDTRDWFALSNGHSNRR